MLFPFPLFLPLEFGLNWLALLGTFCVCVFLPFFLQFLINFIRKNGINWHATFHGNLWLTTREEANKKGKSHGTNCKGN
jgi:hypothetical protein